MSDLRELDAWLAINLFGWEWATDGGYRWLSSLDAIYDRLRRTDDMSIAPYEEKGYSDVPAYTTTGDGMLLVVDAMKAKHNGNLRLFWEMQEETYVAKFVLDVGIMGVGDTIPEAVARAAKAALEVNNGD